MFYMPLWASVLIVLGHLPFPRCSANRVRNQGATLCRACILNEFATVFVEPY